MLRESRYLCYSCTHVFGLYYLGLGWNSLLFMTAGVFPFRDGSGDWNLTMV